MRCNGCWYVDEHLSAPDRLRISEGLFLLVLYHRQQSRYACNHMTIQHCRQMQCCAMTAWEGPVEADRIATTKVKLHRYPSSTTDHMAAVHLQRAWQAQQAPSQVHPFPMHHHHATHLCSWLGHAHQGVLLHQLPGPSWVKLLQQLPQWSSSCQQKCLHASFLLKTCAEYARLLQ